MITNQKAKCSLTTFQLPLPSVTSSPSDRCQRVPPCVPWKRSVVTVVHSPKLLENMLWSSHITEILAKPELSSHLVQRSSSHPPTVLSLVSWRFNLITKYNYWPKLHSVAKNVNYLTTLSFIKPKFLGFPVWWTLYISSSIF